MSYYDEYDDRPRRRSSNAPMWLAVFAFVISAGVFQLWLAPDILHAPSTLLQRLPTASVARPPAADGAARPIGTIRDADADSFQRYNDTVATAAALSGPLPNVNVTGDEAPVKYESKADVRDHDINNVPTSEPLSEPQAEPQVTSAFGSKAVRTPIDIQATHHCLNGQHWTVKGCRNPDR